MNIDIFETVYTHPQSQRWQRVPYENNQSSWIIVSRMTDVSIGFLIVEG
jgi:hypothetical protein